VRVTNLPKALRDFIETGPLAHLATVNANGSPQVTVIWIGLDGDDIVSGHMQMYQKTRNIQREPRVVLSFAAPRTPGVFFAEHAILYATATVEEGGARDLVTRLGKRYVGPDFTFPLPDGAEGYVLRYSVERIGGVGPWNPTQPAHETW
jgi:PPOX class probable F420-dependent enzyme